VFFETKTGVGYRCDRCGSQLIVAANALQASVKRMPSGWMSLEDGLHNCPLCSSAAFTKFRMNSPR